MTDLEDYGRTRRDHFLINAEAYASGFVSYEEECRRRAAPPTGVLSGYQAQGSAVPKAWTPPYLDPFNGPATGSTDKQSAVRQLLRRLFS